MKCLEKLDRSFIEGLYSQKNSINAFGIFTSMKTFEKRTKTFSAD